MKRHKLKPLGLTLLLLMVSACSVTGSLREDPKAKAYKLGALPKAWVQKKVDTTADRVFENTQTKSFLAVNSVCNRYPDSSLSSLTKQLYSPMNRVEISLEETRQVDGRDALFTRVTGTLDGVGVESFFVVLRKNECIFDFTLSSRGLLKPKDVKDFEQLVNSFEYTSNTPEPKHAADAD